MKKVVASILLISILTSYIQGATLITGNASGNNLGVDSFNQPIVANDFNPATGEVFVGLNNGIGSPANVYTISKYSPYLNYGIPASTMPIFQPIAAPALQTSIIDFMALANSLGNINPLLGAVPNGGAYGVLDATQLTVQTTQVISGSFPSTTSPVLLGTNIAVPDANGPPILGIAGLAGGVTRNNKKNYFFVAVFPQVSFPGELPGFGNIGSGIAVVNAVLNTTFFPNPATLQVNQVAAQPGQTGIKAALLDPTVPSVRISGTGEPLIVLNRTSLLWDDQLQRFYDGLQLATNPPFSGSTGDGAASVVLGRLDVNEQGELTLQTFLSSAAIASLVDGNQTYIVAAKQDADMPLDLSAAQLKMLHASTGPSYLIVWGGNGTITNEPSAGNGTVGNLIWALPVVDMQDTTNPTQGTLADKQAPLTNHRFQTQATTLAGITVSSDIFAQVGGGPLPLQPSTPISGVGSGVSDPSYTSTLGPLPVRDSLDIVVSGDTVYVAIATPQTDLDDTGVFYSQAMFDETGKILRWTPWAKRAFPFGAFFNIPQNNGNVRYVNVEPNNGNIIAVDGTIGQSARVTTWDSVLNSSALPKLLNQALYQGSYSALDLNQSFSVISVPGPSRYALFGGINTVAFARTTFSRNDAAPYDVTPPPASNPLENNIPASQKLVTYFTNNGTSLAQGGLCSNFLCKGECDNCSCRRRPCGVNGTTLTFDPTNFLVTTVPSGAGAIKSLEYSKQAPGTPTNYFFAGSNGGLFAFAQGGGAGFDATILGPPNLGALNQPPFSTGSWQPVPAIKGSIVDMKTSGLSLYVLTVQMPLNAATFYTLYRIPFASPLSTMFATVYPIAQTKTGTLSNTLAFYGIQIINMTSNAGLPTSEQLILATNNGLYMTSEVGGVQNATSQIAAGWQLVANSNNTFYSGIGGIDSPIASTAWPISYGSATNPAIYNRSSINQVNGSVSADQITPNPFAFVPVPFNANMLTNPGQPFSNFYPITYFTSDGARRFFILNKQGQANFSNVIQVSPYDVAVNNTQTPNILYNSVLQYIPKFNWIKQIGATGILLAGTNTGVVALE